MPRGRVFSETGLPVNPVLGNWLPILEILRSPVDMKRAGAIRVSGFIDVCAF
jgi:hypothetical protein